MPLPSAHAGRVPSPGWGPVLGVGDAMVVCVCHGGKCVNGINLAVKTQGRRSRSLTASPSRHPATTRSFFRAGVPAEAGGSVGDQFPVTPPCAALPAGAIGCPLPGAGTGQRLNARTAGQGTQPGHPNTGSQLTPPPAPQEAPARTTPQAAGTTTDMRAVFLVLLLWAVACAHPVPGREPARPRHSAQQEDMANEDYTNKLGNLLDGGDGRHPPVSAERGDNDLAGDLVGGNTVGEELGEHGGQDKGDRVGEAQHLNRVDHEDTSAQDGNGLGFLEEDARDAHYGDNGDHHSIGVKGFPSHAGELLDEEDDSGDDTFDENGKDERGEGPTYVTGAGRAGEHGHDTGAVGGHGDSSSSSSSESIGADHQRYRNYLGSRYEQTYRWGGGSSSSQEEEESYNFEDEAMQGDDPSVFDGPGNSYRGHRAGPRSLGSSQESSWGAGSHRWEEGNSRSPEVEGTDSGEDSLSTEDNSQLEELVTSQSEENSASDSREDGDGEDSPSREDEDSKSREGTTEQSDEDLGESPEDISQEVASTSTERSGSQSWQEDQESVEDRSAPSMPDSESREDEDDQSKSTEDTVEESKEDENDSNPDGEVPSTSDESQSASSENDDSQEDNTDEDSRSTESNNSESPEDDDDDNEESHSQEDASHESSSRGDNSSLQSLESGSRKRRPGAYRHKPAADYDDNDCQDGY
ncbi:LOW QUALITY PROTEIN: dentin matrix acidic phosphoprotein 1 [Aegotheles albertisi]